IVVKKNFVQKKKIREIKLIGSSWVNLKRKLSTFCRIIKLGALTVTIYDHVDDLYLVIKHIMHHRIDDSNFFYRTDIIHLQIRINHHIFLFVPNKTHLYRLAINGYLQM